MYPYFGTDVFLLSWKHYTYKGYQLELCWYAHGEMILVNQTYWTPWQAFGTKTLEKIIFYNTRKSFPIALKTNYLSSTVNGITTINKNGFIE